MRQILVLPKKNMIESAIRNVVHVRSVDSVARARNNCGCQQFWPKTVSSRLFDVMQMHFLSVYSSCICIDMIYEKC